MMNSITSSLIVVLMATGIMANPFYQRAFLGEKADDSCVGRCGQTGVDTTKPCQCNPSCLTYNDCCSDFMATCNTCAGRCTAGYNAQWPCQCNDQCVPNNNCCPDRDTLCAPPAAVTDAELRSLSTRLHSIDVNAVAGIVVDLQGTTTSGSTTDRAPLPLFASMPSNAFTGPTISTLIAMFDVWHPDVKVTETVDDARELAFLDAVMATDVMKEAHAFLVSKGLADPSAEVFKQYLRTIWMGLYNRGGGIKGSSGLEHVFGGELNGNSISGFHSWIKFYFEERDDFMNYLGYMTNINLGTTSSMIEMPMNWRGIYKSISSISVASSPELDLAVATVCFITRVDSKCPLAGADGTFYAYQTYTLTQNGVTYVGSAYPTY